MNRVADTQTVPARRRLPRGEREERMLDAGERMFGAPNISAAQILCVTGEALVRRLRRGASGKGEDVVPGRMFYVIARGTVAALASHADLLGSGRGDVLRHRGDVAAET